MCKIINKYYIKLSDISHQLSIHISKYIINYLLSIYISHINNKYFYIQYNIYLLFTFLCSVTA